MIEIEQAVPAPSPARRWLGAACVAAAIAAYYWLLFLPPRLLGSADPDRYFHLGLSRIIATSGLPRTLAQVEDLGWGRFFPDKEFLFHALTGGAWAVGGQAAVLALVPIIGITVVLCLYLEASRRTRAIDAAMLAIVATLGTVGFMFRMSLLRPHILAVLLFLLVVIAILRARPRLAAVAALLFALSYHAFYLVGIVAAVCWLLRRQPGMPSRAWAWCLAGVAVGIVINPYFPSNLGMSAFHLRLALGLGALPPSFEAQEMARLTPVRFLLAYGFLPAVLVAGAVAFWKSKPPVSIERTAWLFLFAVTAVLTAMTMRSPRAAEYAVICGILLIGSCANLFKSRLWIPGCLAILLACQAYVDASFYRFNWNGPQQSAYPRYVQLLAQVPVTVPGAKIFNCDWEAGGFILLARPDLRFVDVLEPAFLWQASPTRFQARRGLVAGAFGDPHAILRGAFQADYVLCASAPLIRQLDARPWDFTSAPGSQGDLIRLFAVRPDDQILLSPSRPR